MRSDTVDLAHFERLYETNSDPWGFASSPYEKAKYAATLAALPRLRYRHALDVGCSIGVLTAALAQRCDDLLAVEPVAAALEQARRRNGDRPWVRFAPMFVPKDWPAGPFDLVVLSEVLDYLGSSDIETLAGRLRASLQAGGDLVLVHWVGKKKRPQSAAEASDLLIGFAEDFLAPIHAERTTDYRLDVFRRRG